MSEEQNQGQTTSDSGQTQDRSQQRQSSSSGEDRTVPYHRFTQLNETNKQIQKELDELRAEREREAEERARQQGEYQKLAEKYKTQAEKEKTARQQLETDIARRERLNTFRAAANGVIVPDAIEDAFYMLHPDDFSKIDNSDEAAMRRLAEQLAETKSFLAVDGGVAGANSGGFTNRPVMSPIAAGGGRKEDSSQPRLGRNAFNKRRKPSWK